MRYSVSALLAIVTLMGVSISALVGSNEQWFRVMNSIVFAAVVIAATISVFGANRSRAFALGFLLACLPYLYLTQPYGSNRSGSLVTDMGLEFMDAHLQFSRERRTPAGETVRLLGNGTAQITGPRKRMVKTWQEIEAMDYAKYAYGPGLVPNRKHYMAIGHLIAALFVGCGNGILASWLKSRYNSANGRAATPEGDLLPPPTIG